MRDTSNQGIRVGIADDHAVIRVGLETLLTLHPDFELGGHAANGDEAVTLARDGDLDVIVLDISMPGPDVVSVLTRLSRHAPGCKVLIYSALPEQQFAPTLHRMGAKAFIDKAAPVDDLVAALRVVAHGGVVFSLRTWEAVAEAALALPMGQLRFTNREFQIFLRLAKGETVTDIANRIGVSSQTVSVYRNRLLRMLNLRSNAQLTRYAVEQGFLQSGDPGQAAEGSAR